MIKDTIEMAMKTGLEQIRAEIQAQTKRLGEAEKRIAQNEDNIQMNQTHITQTDLILQTNLDKLDDLENRSRLNNLRIVGLPET